MCPCHVISHIHHFGGLGGRHPWGPFILPVTPTVADIGWKLDEWRAAGSLPISGDDGAAPGGLERHSSGGQEV